MNRILLGILMAAAAFAQNKPGLRYFINGAGVEMRTESSGGRSPLSTAGSIAGGAPAHRVVLDTADNPLFAYDLDLRKLADGKVSMRISPIDQEKASTQDWGLPKHKRNGPIPTLAAARDFPPLNVGDEVQVDIMYRPSTGEKLWDVLKIVEDRESYPRSPTVERFSFERVTVTIDGKVVAERPNTWMIGQAIRMRIPGHGDYYLVLTPSPDFPFQASGWVDRKVLRFKVDGEQIEVTGKSNILQRSERGTVWVYAETLRKALAAARRTYTQNHPDVRRLQAELERGGAGQEADFSCADNMDQLYPKEQRAKEE